MERLNREINGRTRVDLIFPNTASMYRIVSAIVMEISEEWETGRIYLNTSIKQEFSPQLLLCPLPLSDQSPARRLQAKHLAGLARQHFTTFTL